MKPLELTVRERLIFSTLLPEYGNKIEMMLISDMVEKCKFTPSEIGELELRDAEGRITWNGRNLILNMELTTEQITLLKRYSAETDKNNKVSQVNMSLLAKIDAL